MVLFSVMVSLVVAEVIMCLLSKTVNFSEALGATFEDSTPFAGTLDLAPGPPVADAKRTDDRFSFKAGRTPPS